MLKRSLFLLLVIFTAGIINLSAQTILPLNTAGKIEFTEVVETIDSLKKEKLFTNANGWFQSFKKNPDIKILSFQKDSLNNKIASQFQFTVYQQSGVLKKIVGTVTYSLTLDFKDFKYRYSFTDFVFHYYKQDRNYNFVDTGKTKNLEENNAPTWNKTWVHCRTTTGEKVKSQIASIKLKMIEKDKPSTPITEVKKADW